jgi:hypothetical protein
MVVVIAGSVFVSVAKVQVHLAFKNLWYCPVLNKDWFACLSVEREEPVVINMCLMGVCVHIKKVASPKNIF